ncbi:MAG: zinc ribbon domain-containing protein [Phycisphaerae bacterium]|nr:zinc ribbon domain-containing protein [Phycisphaerae bacterium]
MPIYEYLCGQCGHKFELLKAKMSKNSREKCPECGGTAPQQFSVFGVGSGGSSSQAPCAATGSCPTGTACCDGGTCPFGNG